MTSRWPQGDIHNRWSALAVQHAPPLAARADKQARGAIILLGRAAGASSLLISRQSQH